ncbi:MAG: hypothetical protein AAGF12_30900 [Myxococcota bacterium]
MTSRIDLTAVLSDPAAARSHSAAVRSDPATLRSDPSTLRFDPASASAGRADVRRGTWVALLGIALAMFPGCGDSADGTEPPVDATVDAPMDSSPDGPVVPASVEVGLGISDFQPIMAGTEAELVFGPQGGWHIDVAARVYGLAPDQLVLTYEMFNDQGTAISEPLSFRLSPRRVIDAGDHFIRLGDRAVFDIDAEDEVLGSTIEIRAAVETENGTVAEDRRMVRVIAAGG